MIPNEPASAAPAHNEAQGKRRSPPPGLQKLSPVHCEGCGAFLYWSALGRDAYRCPCGVLTEYVRADLRQCGREGCQCMAEPEREARRALREAEE